MTTQPEPDLSLLLHAVGIVEWAGALRHLLALEQMGVPEEVPLRRLIALNTTRNELGMLIHRWPRLTSITMTNEEVIEEARAYITKHQHRLDDLIQGD